jgi:transcription antitermination factor NusA-like protein
MNKNDFQKVISETFSAIVKLTRTKGEEYARSEDQLANFKRSAEEAGIEPEQVWVVFFNKHIDAIKTFAKGGKVLSEPIEGRIDDAILYLILYKAMVRESIQNMTKPVEVPQFEPFPRCNSKSVCRERGSCRRGSEFCD